MKLARGPYDLMIILALDAGLRRNEVITLVWQRVNLNKREITIDQITAKSHRSRVIPIPDRLFERLSIEDDRKGNVVKCFGRQFKTPRTAIEKFFHAAGLEDFHFHDLRHTYATRLADQGVPVELIMVALGHSTILQTMRYNHTAVARRHEISAAINRSNSYKVVIVEFEKKDKNAV